MMFETGFLGTHAPFFMDVMTLYFALLPFLLAYSVSFAVHKKFETHIRSQLFIFGFSMFMILFFEVGVRLDGGFNAYMQESRFPYSAVLLYLIVHVVFALLTVVVWGATVYSGYKAYKQEGLHAPFFIGHKKRARWLFVAITITSIMGCSMYGLMFL